MIFAEIIVYAGFVYLGLGVLFAVWFVCFGVSKFDASARGTGFGFRLIILFGAAALWFFLLRRAVTSDARSKEQNAHCSEAEK